MQRLAKKTGNFVASIVARLYSLIGLGCTEGRIYPEHTTTCLFGFIMRWSEVRSGPVVVNKKEIRTYVTYLLGHIAGSTFEQMTTTLRAKNHGFITAERRRIKKDKSL
jgi:hypothetical protein